VSLILGLEIDVPQGKLSPRTLLRLDPNAELPLEETNLDIDSGIGDATLSGLESALDTLPFTSSAPAPQLIQPVAPLIPAQQNPTTPASFVSSTRAALNQSLRQNNVPPTNLTTDISNLLDQKGTPISELLGSRVPLPPPPRPLHPAVESMMQKLSASRNSLVGLASALPNSIAQENQLAAENTAAILRDLEVLRKSTAVPATTATAPTIFSKEVSTEVG
jgi:hypothetical protein